MSFVLVASDMLETAATELAQVGSAMTAANLAAMFPTTAVAAAAADEVSAAAAALFGMHAQEYQAAAAAQAATYHEQFVRALSAAAASYVGAEATIATSIRGTLDALTGFDPIGAARHELFGTGGNCGTSNAGGTEQSIVIDFVRHGQSTGNAAALIDTAVPGSGLTQLGTGEAQAIATALGGQGPFAGIFASQLIRTQATAAPLAGLLGMNVQILPGLNEINAGVFNGMPQISLGGLLYLPAPVAWTLGLPLVPMLAPGSAHLNGVMFEQGFTGTLQTMYANAMANPVHAANGQVTEVAFSSEFAIEVGTMMTVKNPAPLLMLTHPLPYTGVVVLQGNPQAGWTLVSWDGMPVPPASLPTKLFVDVRDLIKVPQYAAYNIGGALATGDPTTIVGAIRDGVDDVGAAAVRFPFAVTRDLLETVAGPSLGHC